MTASMLAVPKRFALIAVILCGQSHAQASGEINLSFAIDDKVTSLTQEDALCQRACSGVVWSNDSKWYQ